MALLFAVIGQTIGQVAQNRPQMPKQKNDSTIIRTCSHSQTIFPHIGRIRLQIAAPSPVFARLGIVRFIFLSKLGVELNEEVIAATMVYFADVEKMDLSDG